jgi:hypothetical protein
MDRTIAPGSVGGLHVDEDPALSVQGSLVTAQDRNALQEELVNLIEHAGLAPSRTDNEQVRQAIQILAEDAGAIGEVMMFDGAGWVDNETKPGWYACVPENEDGGSAGLSFGITSMVDRFAMGKSVAAPAATGGKNTIAAADLPEHRHTINHDHAPVTSGEESQNHVHNLTSFLRVEADVFTVSPATGAGTILVYGPNQSATPALDNASLPSSPSGYGPNNRSHTHQVNLPNFTGDSGPVGSSASVDNRPSFYSMLFIRKCEHAF